MLLVSDNARHTKSSNLLPDPDARLFKALLRTATCYKSIVNGSWQPCKVGETPK